MNKSTKIFAAIALLAVCMAALTIKPIPPRATVHLTNGKTIETRFAGFENGYFKITQKGKTWRIPEHLVRSITFKKEIQETATDYVDQNTGFRQRPFAPGDVSGRRDDMNKPDILEQIMQEISNNNFDKRIVMFRNLTLRRPVLAQRIEDQLREKVEHIKNTPNIPKKSLARHEMMLALFLAWKRDTITAKKFLDEAWAIDHADPVLKKLHGIVEEELQAASSGSLPGPVFRPGQRPARRGPRVPKDSLQP